ncbi:hypothetical protein [Kitasatospora brasiliensis]|uniref:hypothetical protein n=1 Tax=Kitasatospora brasiliensis TaxID=3058040 RepID=UPI002930CBE5|nr:hypothetical protein [Kitasatospora sp. K002]
MITAFSGGASRPSAGALRLIEARTENPVGVGVDGYLAGLFEHCPFLGPSVRRGMTGWTVYEIVPGSHRYAVEAELFYAGVQAAEWVRPLTSRSYGLLACENVVLTGRCEGADHRELLAWPHWALKHLYAPVGVMVGKFPQGAVESGRRGQAIAPPPFSFLAVRAGVRPLDPKFLTKTPNLAMALAVAVDDGRDVFEHIPCDWKAVREWASSLPRPQQR